MSHVDNVLVSWGILEDGESHTNDINEWCKNHLPRQQQFVNVAEQEGLYGGMKYMETDLLAAAFNNFATYEEEFLEFLRGLSWKEPQFVQFIIKRQHSDEFVMIHPLKNK
jgi:hypothetical protein